MKAQILESTVENGAIKGLVQFTEPGVPPQVFTFEKNLLPHETSDEAAVRVCGELHEHYREMKGA